MSRLSRRAVAVLAASLAIPLVALLPAVANATPRAPRVPHAPVNLPADIEDLQPYVPQDSCDATAKPGAVALLALLMKTYPGTTNMGIAQTCAAEGMTSEHAEGRALDWGVNVHNRGQKAQAEAMLSWLFADTTLPDGTVATQANARRLGVMYVIWNNRIRSAGGDWEAYMPKVCAKKGSSDTICHRNHVHISLGWSGAWKRTSFWTGRVAGIDYGPCVPTGKKYAPKYRSANPSPCPSGRHFGGEQASAPPVSAPVTLPAPPAWVPPAVDPAADPGASPDRSDQFGQPTPSDPPAPADQSGNPAAARVMIASTASPRGNAP